MHVNSPREGAAVSRTSVALHFCAVLAALAATSLGGCRRDEVTHFRVAKESPAQDLARPAGMTMGGEPGGGDVAAPPAPEAASRLRWTLPKGWTQSLAGGMRYATLKPSAQGRIDISVVVLPGPAGGELANVNRWRGQIGLPPVDEAALGAARKTLRSKAGPVSLYDFTSEGKTRSRTIAGLTSARGNTWFIKMTGDADAVGTARPDFLRLMETLRFED
jgi:hypothetical protein